MTTDELRLEICKIRQRLAELRCRTLEAIECDDHYMIAALETERRTLSRLLYEVQENFWDLQRMEYEGAAAVAWVERFLECGLTPKGN